MSKTPIPHPFDELDRNRLLRSVTPTSIGVASAAAFLALGPKSISVPDVVRNLPGAEALAAVGCRVPNSVYVAATGFLAGYGTARSLNWLRWTLLRSLFSYKGWVYGNTSYKTQMWALLIKLLRGPPPHETFAFQPYLPKQPLPELNASLDKWMGVAKHIISSEEFEQTVEAVEEFRETVGPKLHAHLQEKARKDDNWIADYWVNLAYLANRDSIAVNNNYYIVNSTFPTLTTDSIARTASTIVCHMDFHQKLQDDIVPAVTINGLVPLCMHGFRYIFNAVRLPGETMDSIQRFPSARHIVVIRKGHYFKLDVTALDRVTRRMRKLTVNELYQQLCQIQQLADGLATEAPVAALTSQNRTQWAKQRQVLKTRNEDTLQAVESAMFIVCMDDYVPKDTGDFATRCITGNGDDRWFDKCFTFVSSPTGTRLGWNVEHSVIDAMVFGQVPEHSFYTEQRMYEADGTLKKDSVHTPRDLDMPQRLEWHVADLEQEIQTAYKAHRGMAGDLDLVAYSPPFGKGVMKKCRVSPDGFIQMALQLAFYRVHKEIPKTYEPSTCRIFLLGRTETVHPVSPDSVAWVKSMNDPSSMMQSRQEFLRRAIKSQTQFRLDATVGQGCDRYLLGLFCASRELGMDIPKLFMDKAWRIPFKLSTSQTPTKMWDYGCDLDYLGCAGGFGPGCHDGYGVSYIVLGDDIINFQITSWRSCTETDSRMFSEAIATAFLDMKAVFFS